MLNDFTRWLNGLLLKTGQDRPNNLLNQLLDKLGLRLRPVRVRAPND
ncbi:MAG: hypothetical protein GX171_08205 [Clostridiales bacterium]|jgi:hypothetical protein|nr:hypothetical protein [Clostridiales bacterium]